MVSLSFVLIPIIALTAVIQDDVTTTDKINFSYKEVCQKMVTHETPLIEAFSGTELDCMGKKVAVGDFCDKELAHDPYYLRGYVNKETKEVICQSGKKVIFKYQCARMKDKHLCASNPSNACQLIQAKLAKRLDMVHSSVTKNKVGIKELNCYFESLPLKEKSVGSL